MIYLNVYGYRVPYLPGSGVSRWAWCADYFAGIARGKRARGEALTEGFTEIMLKIATRAATE